MSDPKPWGCAIFASILAVVILFFTSTPPGTRILRGWWKGVRQVDKHAQCEVRKEVENTCRALMSSYAVAKLTYEQCATVDGTDARLQAEQAKMRANKTARTYNNYVRKHTYVWRGNMPDDIEWHLPYLK